MKVAAFVEYLPPKLGSDRRIFEIMKRLTSEHEVHFVVFPCFENCVTNHSEADKTLRLAHGMIMT